MWQITGFLHELYGLERKITVVDVKQDGIRGAPRALDDAQYVRLVSKTDSEIVIHIIAKPCLILLHHPCWLVAAVLAFKGHTTWDSKVFMS